jgi:hypothetical protein
MAGFHRFQEVMALEPDIVDAEDVVPDWPIKGEIASRIFPLPMLMIKISYLV